MKMFSYRACTVDGQIRCGVVAAESAPAAVRALAAEGKTALDIRERLTVRMPSVPILHGGITPEDRIAFLHELAALLGAGMPVHEALGHIRTGVASDSVYGQLVCSLHADVLRGLSLSQAMELRDARAFAPSLVGMVRAGEESGRLDTILHEAAEVAAEAHILRESLRSALAYPFFLLAATAVSVLLMIIFVLPVFAVLLRDLGAELPLPTRILLGLSDAVAAHPYALPVAAAAVLMSGVLCRRVPRLCLYVDAFLLRVPVLGTFVRLVAWQTILRTLTILLRSGIRLDSAVGLASSVTDNRALSLRLERMEQRLVEGRTFSQVVARESSLPELLRGMLSAGEAAGDPERLLVHAADYCRRRADVYAARMEALAEPLMISLVGCIIFFVVLSVLLPIFDAMDAMM